jgi:class 3 adenylate cyclase
MIKTIGPENEVAVLITDIHQYSRLTANMSAEGIRDYMIGYHGHLQTMVMDSEGMADEFEPCAGDASVAIFKQKAGEDGKEKCRRALKVALTIAEAIESGEIPFTRIGIYVGDIIEAPFGPLTLRFGNCFAAANRLEELCAYFGTTILMDREVALAQDDLARYVVAIGKVTPKSFEHPIHVYSIYKPGIHKCPANVNEDNLRTFITLKNEAIEYFIGNAQKRITANFQVAEQKLHQAEMAFREATGQLDVATLRISQYIHENPYPVDTFERQGMAINEKQGPSIGIRLLLLSQQLIKAFDQEFYHALIENTDWESLFRIQWFKKGDVIMKMGDEPNGIYYLARGDVRVQDAAGNTVAHLSDGDIFGEMAYFTNDRRRSATVVAMTDIAVRRISTEDFEKTPVLHNLFAEIARRRTRPV